MGGNGGSGVSDTPAPQDDALPQVPKDKTLGGREVQSISGVGEKNKNIEGSLNPLPDNKKGVFDSNKNTNTYGASGGDKNKNLLQRLGDRLEPSIFNSKDSNNNTVKPKTDAPSKSGGTQTSPNDSTDNILGHLFGYDNGYDGIPEASDQPPITTLAEYSGELKKASENTYTQTDLDEKLAGIKKMDKIIQEIAGENSGKIDYGGTILRAMWESYKRGHEMLKIIETPASSNLKNKDNVVLFKKVLGDYGSKIIDKVKKYENNTRNPSNMSFVFAIRHIPVSESLPSNPVEDATTFQELYDMKLTDDPNQNILEQNENNIFQKLLENKTFQDLCKNHSPLGVLIEMNNIAGNPLPANTLKPLIYSLKINPHKDMFEK